MHVLSIMTQFERNYMVGANERMPDSTTCFSLSIEIALSMFIVGRRHEC